MSNHPGRRRSGAGDEATGPRAPARTPPAEAAQLFTISEVNALIPSLNLIVAQQLRQQSDIEQGLAELTQRCGRNPESLEPCADDEPDCRKLKSELRQRIGRYESGWSKVRALGGIVKDPQIGLVDFYGRVEGRVVWLCWRYGEDSLGYYHELEEGYSGRRPISANVRKHLVN